MGGANRLPPYLTGLGPLEEPLKSRIGPAQPKPKFDTAYYGRARTRRAVAWPLFAIAALLLVWYHHSSHVFFPGDPAPSAESEGWTWAKIKPSVNLTWERCYNDTYDCARLDLPMDWLEPGADRVVLAVIRLRATDPTDYRGPVFFNPGGPGGSGVWSMLDHGKFVQQIVGTNHDIIAFDPRGIGSSVPRIECWSSDQQRTFWDLVDVGVADAHPGVVYDQYARSTAVSQRCETAMRDSVILKHISTASHARDMLEILLQTGHEKLRYWGFSYGTVLGGTFAAMYPDRVERLVSDGNVDYKEWFLDQHINFLRDADKVLDAFYELCSKVGPESCAFYSQTPAEIERRFKALLEDLRINPIVLPIGSQTGLEMPEVVTYSKVRRLLSSVLYQPLFHFPEFAGVLAALEAGDGIPFLRMASGGSPPPPLASFCSALPVEPSVPLSAVVEGTEDAFPAVMCADHEPWTGSARDFARLADELQDISFAVGAVATLVRSSCVGWHVRPKWRFTGPFEAKTAFPILFIANAADNVTPLVSARNNSEGFEGSVVLVQNSYGHTTLAAPSTCTAKHIRAYFQDGALPKSDARCEADHTPFDPYPVSVAESEDSALSYAVMELSRRARAHLGRRRAL